MVPETAVADFVKAGGEDVLEKSAHELWSGQTASSRLFAIAWLDLEGDALIVEGNDPAVGEGGSEDVACEIIEDGLLAIPPWGAMNDPGLGPTVSGTVLARPALVKPARSLPRITKSPQ